MQRTARARAGLALLTALAALALTAAPALAVEGHTFSTSFNGGTEHPLSEPEGLGIDQMTGEVYVADRKNNDVEVFNEAGTWQATFGKAGTGKGEFKEPTELAVSNDSGGLTEGDLAVIDSGNKRVEIFNATHEAIIEISAAELNKLEPNKGGLQKLDGIAYDSSGNLWLFLTKNGISEVYERTEGGTLDRPFEVKFSFNRGLAVTPAGTLLFGNSTGASQLGPAGEALEGFGHEEAAGGETTGVTLDPVGEGAYVDRGVEVAHFPAPRSKELARSDDFGTSGSGKLAMGVGIAVRTSTHDVYVADSGERRVDVYAPVTLASASQEPVTGVTPTSAYVSGQVDPDGVAVSTCEFEYEEGKKTQACSPTPGSGSSYEKVSASLSGLTEGKEYELRLAVSDANGVSYAPQLPRFTTPYSFQAKTAGEGTGSLECEVEGKAKEPCADAYAKGTVLTAYAEPAAGSKFEGWTVLEGPTNCNGKSEPCLMGVEGPVKIVANFAKNTGGKTYPLTVKKTGSGKGTVLSKPAGIDCLPGQGECSQEYPAGTKVELTETPEAGAEFVKWEGCESETGPGKEVCEVTISAATGVTAQFTQTPLTKYPLKVLLEGTGEGEVTGAGIECGSGHATCEAEVSEGATVALDAHAATGSALLEWKGCTTVNAGVCEVLASEAKTVTAVFDTLPAGLEGHTFSTSFNGGSEHALSEPEGLAIDQMTGEVYVADRKSNDVEVFNASGTWLATIGKAGTGKGEFKEPTELAVDNSEGLGEGDLAVIDAGNKRVEIFNAKHEPIIELSTAELNKVEPNKGGLQKLDGIAYDTDGDLWLFLTKNGVNEVYERTEGGTLDRAFEVKEEFKGGLAVTPAGTILFGSSSGVSQFGPAGEGLEGFGHEEAAGGETTGVALDPVGEGAYVDRGIEVAHFPAPRSKELARSDDFGTSGSGKLAMGVGIAVRTSTHDVYVADSAEHRVDAFAPVTLASASQEPVTGVTPTSAYVSGQVDPDGVAVSTCEFEYEEGKKTQACSPTPGSGSSYEKVSASLSGLTEGKNYEVRLSVTDADGVSYAQQLPRFTTPYSFQAKTAGEGTGSLECEVEGKTKEPCADAYPKGTVLTAYAQPGSESTFEGWTVLEGPTKCNGTSEPCFMAIEQPRKIVANFAKNTGATKYPLTVKKTGAGRGTVESSPSGIDCKPAEGECSHEFEEGKSVELKQTPEAGSEFVKWTGCDSEAAGKCLVTMTAPKTVEAEFKLSSTTVLPKPVSEPPSNVELEVQSGHPIVTATLHGKLAPEGVPLSSCAFEYGTSTSYGQTAPCVPAAKEIPTGGETPVTARVTLAPGTTYHYRLSAANKNGGALGADESFATPARTVGEAAWWRLNSTSRPSSLQPGKTGVLVVVLEDVGDGPVDALGDPVTIDDALPHGLRATGAGAITVFSNDSGAVPCAPREAGAAVTCTFSGHAPEMPGEPREKTFMEDSGLPPFVDIELRIPVQVSETASLCEPHSPTCERNLVDVSGGGAPPASLSRPVLVSPSPPAFGVADDEFDPEEAGGAADTQAGSHPFQVGFDVVLNQDLEEGEYGAPGEGERPFVHPVALAKDLRFKLPPGFVGDPSAIPACPISKFLHGTLAGNAKTNECPADTAIGVATTGYLLPRSFGYRVVDLPFFNLEPQVGEPARFGFFVPEGESGIGVFIDTAVRAGEDYGVTSTTSNISQQVAFAFAKVTLWGVPGDPRHDPQRGYGCLDTAEGPIPGLSCTGLEGTHPPPFFDMPTSCTGPLHTSVEADSWQDQGHFQSFASEPVPAMQGCNHLQFTPEIKVTPDGTRASTPTGLDVDVHVPQEGQLNAEGLAQSNIRGIQVTLPAGVTLNPSAADGLAACTANTASPLGGALGVPGNQVGYEGIRALEGEPGVSAPTFTPYKPQSTDALAAGFSEPFQQGVNFCPDASKVATVTIKTPLLPNPVLGAVYLASPQNFNVFPPENPFSKHVAMYILAEDPVSGALVKLPGRVELGGEPGASVELAPGQIRSYFEDNPQLPFEDAEVHFFGGERAPLATPDHCGTYTTQALYTPWDGGEPVHSSSSFQITSGPNGGPCPGPSLPFTPELHSSVTNINAGSFSDLSTTLSRPTGDQDIGSVTLHYPPGVSGLLSGVELCPEPQADEGTCAPNSQIGETIVSVGVGGEPFTVTGGRAYLTGPYNGSGSCTPGESGCAPFGLSIVNPAKAGPFVLQQGRPVIVRAKVEVDPTTAALTVTTDASGAHAIPTIVEGFPLQIQHVNVLVNRPGFTFNPTSCDPMSITGTISSAEGASSPLSDPFQVANCATLKYEPTLTLSTAGHASKADGASLDFKIVYPKGAMGSQSWFNYSKFDIPKQLPAELKTIQKACLADVFEKERQNCPSASIIGHAVVHTEVLPVPLEGPVYFVSYGNAKFPDAVLVLKGYGITVELHGHTFIDNKTGVTSATFESLPDVPFESIEVSIPQGPFSEFGSNLPHESYDFCGQKLTMPVIFKASNGAEIQQHTPVAVTGCPTAISLSSHSLKARRLTLSVYVPAAGKLKATGKGLRAASKAATGQELLTLTLNASRRGSFKTRLKLTFTPTKGRRQSKSLSLRA